MMPSYMAMSPVGPTPTTGYSTDSFMDDLSRQFSMSHARRFSRGSNGHGQQHIGAPMRVTKPSSSASNSPRSAMVQARRRTVVNMNDGLLARRNQQLLEHAYLPTPAPEPTIDEPMKRSARPVSWHPSSSQLGQPQQQQQQLPVHQQQTTSPLAQYPFPAYNDVDFYPHYYQQLPPTPAAYSGYNSPTTAFSPLSLPYSAFESPRYLQSTANWVDASHSTKAIPSPTTLDCPGLVEQGSQSSERSSNSSSDITSQWNSFVTHGFNKATPPTPDPYPTVPPPEPVIPSDDSIPYQPLEGDEEEGEILIGMGLYDPPEKPIIDSTLETYRASVAHILGSAYNYPEPTGRGLKLEDAWEPPAKDDDDDDDEGEDDSNSDDDADGDEQEDNA